MGEEEVRGALTLVQICLDEGFRYRMRVQSCCCAPVLSVLWLTDSIELSWFPSVLHLISKAIWLLRISLCAELCFVQGFSDRHKRAENLVRK